MRILVSVVTALTRPDCTSLHQSVKTIFNKYCIILSWNIFFVRGPIYYQTTSPDCCPSSLLSPWAQSSPGSQRVQISTLWSQQDSNHRTQTGSTWTLLGKDIEIKSNKILTHPIIQRSISMLRFRNISFVIDLSFFYLHSPREAAVTS